MDDKNISALWGHLHWLVILAEQQSFTGTAQRLHVSKAAVSQRMAELERSLGVALIRRTTRSVQLTDAGTQLVQELRPAFDSMERSFSNVKDASGRLQGVIRVTAPVALARQQLLPHFARFLKANEGVRIELDLSDRMVSLSREGFDLAIRHTDDLPQTHVAVRLCSTQAVLVASEAYLQQHGKPKHPQDLENLTCLHYPRSGDMAAWRFTKKSATAKAREQASWVKVKSVLAANNSEALRDAALADLGIAMIPDFTAQAALWRGDLVQVLPEWEFSGHTFAQHIYAVRPYTVHAPLAVSALLAFMKEALSPGFPLRA